MPLRAGCRAQSIMQHIMKHYQPAFWLIGLLDYLDQLLAAVEKAIEG